MKNGPEKTTREEGGRSLPGDARWDPAAGSEPTLVAEGAQLDLPEADDPEFDELLRQTLRHEQPYAGFADRVMSRIADEDAPVQVASAFGGTRKLLHWPQRRLWVAGAVAAALVVGLFEGEVALQRAREQQRRIVQATQQFQTTERVTVRALAQAREQLQRAGVPLSLD